MFTKITLLENSVLYVEAEGKLDIYNAPYYLEAVKDRIKIYVNEVVLEFSKISFVASIGLRAILDIYKTTQAKGCKLILKNVNEDTMHSFKFTGFDKFLIFENDTEEPEEEVEGTQDSIQD